ncbi:chitinase [Elysia marginata]|uniref:Chitinase n=1 Tax=Elysia marginata TaxID=1093978 RepID=A0AAV4F9G9_9GAST|nr:chitinase [Elysia marginata]
MPDGSVFSLYVLFFLSLFIFQQGASKEFLRLCYFPSWASSRPSPLASYGVSDIDPKLCTHIVYAFGKIDRDSKLLVPTTPLLEDSRPNFVGKYRLFNDIKRENSRLKTLLSLGGQNDDGSGFKIITESDIIVKRFAENAVKFLRKRDFDGLDIDWEYPTKETKRSFVLLLKALREAFDAEVANGHSKLLLTIAGPPGLYYIEPGYDIHNIARYVDYVNLMTYDYTTKNAQIAAFNSPLYSRKDMRFDATLSTDWTVRYWHDRGLPFHKMLVGITGVGRRLVLSNVNETEVGSDVTGEIRTGDVYGIPGGLVYPEICTMLNSIKTKRYFDYEQRVPYLVKGDDWVGYEDEESISVKIPWMMRLGVAGVMFWSLDQDDFTGKFCDDGKYPLLRAMKAAITKEIGPVSGEDVNPDIVFLTGHNQAVSRTNSIPLIYLCCCLHVAIVLFTCTVLSADGMFN